MEGRTERGRGEGGGGGGRVPHFSHTKSREAIWWRSGQ